MSVFFLTFRLKSGRMMYMYQGDIYVNDFGANTKEFKAVKEEYDEQRLSQLLFYVYYMWKKEGNHYFHRYSENERKEIVINDYNLPTDIDNELANVTVREFVSYWKDIQFSENELNAEAFRNKISHWRDMLLAENEDANKEKAYAEALERSTKLYQEYKTAAEQEQDQEETAASIFMFEVPEHHKQPHLRYKLVT